MSKPSLLGNNSVGLGIREVHIKVTEETESNDELRGGKNERKEMREKEENGKSFPMSVYFIVYIS